MRDIMFALPLGARVLLQVLVIGLGLAVGWFEFGGQSPRPTRVVEIIVPRQPGAPQEPSALEVAKQTLPIVVAPTPSAIAAEAALCQAGGGELFAAVRPDEFVCVKSP
jgi:hypothetical protein